MAAYKSTGKIKKRGVTLFSSTIPLILIALILVLVAGLFWHFRYTNNQKINTPWARTRSDVQVWLLVLAAFVMGVFLAYVLFTLPL